MEVDTNELSSMPDQLYVRPSSLGSMSSHPNGDDDNNNNNNNNNDPSIPSSILPLPFPFPLPPAPDVVIVVVVNISYFEDSTPSYLVRSVRGWWDLNNAMPSRRCTSDSAIVLPGCSHFVRSCHLPCMRVSSRLDRRTSGLGGTTLRWRPHLREDARPVTSHELSYCDHRPPPIDSTSPHDDVSTTTIQLNLCLGVNVRYPPRPRRRPPIVNGIARSPSITRIPGEGRTCAAAVVVIPIAPSPPALTVATPAPPAREGRGTRTAAAEVECGRLGRGASIPPPPPPPPATSAQSRGRCNAAAVRPLLLWTRLVFPRWGWTTPGTQRWQWRWRRRGIAILCFGGERWDVSGIRGRVKNKL